MLLTACGGGDPIGPPVRVVPLGDGRLGGWTTWGSGAEGPADGRRVVVQPCDARGRPREGTSPLDGTAEVVRSGGFFEEVRGRLREEGGARTVLARLRTALGRRGASYAAAVVLVRID